VNAVFDRAQRESLVAALGALTPEIEEGLAAAVTEFRRRRDERAARDRDPEWLVPTRGELRAALMRIERAAAQYDEALAGLSWFDHEGECDGPFNVRQQRVAAQKVRSIAAMMAARKHKPGPTPDFERHFFEVSVAVVLWRQGVPVKHSKNGIFVRVLRVALAAANANMITEDPKPILRRVRDAIARAEQRAAEKLKRDQIVRLAEGIRSPPPEPQLNPRAANQTAVTSGNRDSRPVSRSPNDEKAAEESYPERGASPHSERTSKRSGAAVLPHPGPGGAVQRLAQDDLDVVGARRRDASTAGADRDRTGDEGVAGRSDRGLGARAHRRGHIQSRRRLKWQPAKKRPAARR